MEAAQQLALLSLPAELRNRIWSLTLLETERIDMSHKCRYRIPGLLSACRQIREEAAPIYYSENHFNFVVHGYDRIKATPAYQLVRKHRKQGVRNFKLELCTRCPRVDIDSLEQWLKAYHQDTKSVIALRQSKSAEDSSYQTIARRTFGVVKAMEKAPWTKVLRVLEAFYEAIEALMPDLSDESDWDYDDDEEDDEDGGNESDDSDVESRIGLYRTEAWPREEFSEEYL